MLGGAIRILPKTNNTESSIAFYAYTDERSSAAADMWAVGSNACGETGFSIGTPSKQACLNITPAGLVKAPYNIQTQSIYVDSIYAKSLPQVSVQTNLTVS